MSDAIQSIEVDSVLTVKPPYLSLGHCRLLAVRYFLMENYATLILENFYDFSSWCKGHSVRTPRNDIDLFNLFNEINWERIFFYLTKMKNVELQLHENLNFGSFSSNHTAKLLKNRQAVAQGEVSHFAFLLLLLNFFVCSIFR